MISLWILFFPLIVLVHSIPQSADNVDPQPIVNPGSSIAFQDALGDDKSSDALPPSQNPPFSDTDFSQNSIAAETGLSQDATTAGTDRSQPELVAETDSSRILMADCTSAAPTDDLSDGNSQILTRDNPKGFCPTEPTVPPLTRPNPPPPKPEPPVVEPDPYLTPKPRPRSKTRIPPGNPILRSDNKKPCPPKDGKHDTATKHVTCGGPESSLRGYSASESRWVVNCLEESHSIIEQRTIFPETKIVAEYCCEYMNNWPSAFASSRCVKIKALYNIERLEFQEFLKKYQKYMRRPRPET